MGDKLLIHPRLLKLFDGQTRLFHGGKDVVDFMEGALSAIFPARRSKPHRRPGPSLHVRMHRRDDGPSAWLKRAGYALEKFAGGPSRRIEVVAWAMVIFGIVLWVVDRISMRVSASTT